MDFYGKGGTLPADILAKLKENPDIETPLYWAKPPNEVSRGNCCYCCGPVYCERWWGNVPVDKECFRVMCPKYCPCLSLYLLTLGITLIISGPFENCKVHLNAQCDPKQYHNKYWILTENTLIQMTDANSEPFVIPLSFIMTVEYRNAENKEDMEDLGWIFCYKVRSKLALTRRSVNLIAAKRGVKGPCDVYLGPCDELIGCPFEFYEQLKTAHKKVVANGTYEAFEAYMETIEMQRT